MHLILRNPHTILLAHCQKELGAAAKLNAVSEYSMRNVKVNMLLAREKEMYLPIFQYMLMLHTTDMYSIHTSDPGSVLQKCAKSQGMGCRH